MLYFDMVWGVRAIFSEHFEVGCIGSRGVWLVQLFPCVPSAGTSSPSRDPMCRVMMTMKAGVIFQHRIRAYSTTQVRGGVQS